MREPLSASMLSFVLPALGLFLVLNGLTGRSGWRLGNRGRAGLLLVSLGVLCLPLDGLSLARRFAGAVNGVSIPTTALLLHATLRGFGGAGLFRAAELRTAWIFGAVAGLALYPLALGLGPLDPYVAGWQFSALFGVMGVVAAGLIGTGNRFGWVLLAAVAAWHLRGLESTNYWDYLVDPLYVLVSLGLVIGRSFRRSTPQSSPPGTLH